MVSEGQWTTRCNEGREGDRQSSVCDCVLLNLQIRTNQVVALRLKYDRAVKFCLDSIWVVRQAGDQSVWIHVAASRHLDVLIVLSENRKSIARWVIRQWI